MGQETYTWRRSSKKETSAVSVDGDSPGFEFSPAVLLERPPDSDVCAVERVEVLPIQLPETPVFTEFLVRGLDVVCSVVLLLLAAPAMLFTVLLVKLSSAGPVLFRQKRVGKHGRIFTLLKFRTMVDNAEEHTGPVLASKEDERVTPVGKVLRCTRLDELPQLFNVLQGDMSLVGPRPERPYFVERHKALKGFRLAVKPGITGLAQIRAFYDLKPEHKLKYDYLYIQNRSLFLNAYILLKTVPVILLRKGW